MGLGVFPKKDRDSDPAPNDAYKAPSSNSPSSDDEATKKTQDHEDLERINTFERVGTKADYYEKGGLRTEGDGVDHDGTHQKFTFKLFGALLAMSFLWVGSQIPLYLFGGILPDIYGEIGGYDRWVWMIIAYLIPNAALCPFVGALSDLFGRKWVAMAGQIFLVVGPIVTATANEMNIAIAGQVISGAGAGLNELISLAATGEMVPTAKRGIYVGGVVMTILPFAPSVLWAQLIVQASDWRYVGAFIAGWNALGLILLFIFYWPPPRPNSHAYTRKEILKRVDYIGGILSIGGVLCFMMGMQWGAQQYQWTSAHVLVPFFIGIALIIGFFVWEVKFARYPMVPPRIFSTARRTMTVTLLITFLSGANFFNVLLFWPTEIYNVYGNDRVAIGIRSLPVGFGILGGAVISLVLIPITKGRVRLIMIFFTALMTAGTGAMVIARPDNINTTYVPVSLACIGVGGVIIPVSIIAQIVCPDDLIATITAITLSIRYIGGAIGFTVYYNIFFRKVYENVFQGVATETVIYKLGYVTGLAQGDQSRVTAVSQAYAQAQYRLFDYLSAVAFASPEVQARNPGLTLNQFQVSIKNATHWAMADAYQWPYWISIAFGGTCVILACFLGDISQFLDEHVAVVL